MGRADINKMTDEDIINFLKEILTWNIKFYLDRKVTVWERDKFEMRLILKKKL